VLTAGLENLLRRHLLVARRSSLGITRDSGYETRHLCVGFVDLVGSTAIAQRSATTELGAILSEFERISTETVTAGGGRVIKLIGDEILYTAPEEVSGCTIALQLTDLFAGHPALPPARAGVASGEVMMRDGDVFGPVVNLAARAVDLAQRSEVVVPAAVAHAAGMTSKPLGGRRLKGFEHEIELCRLERSARRA
jgi:adenylate cyclase